MFEKTKHYENVENKFDAILNQENSNVEVNSVSALKEYKSYEQELLETAFREASDMGPNLEDYKNYIGTIKEIYYSKTQTNKYDQIVFIYEVKDETGYTNVFDSFVFTGKNNKYTARRIKRLVEEFGLYLNTVDMTSFSNMAKSLEIFVGTKIKVMQEPAGESDYKRYVVTPLQKYCVLTSEFVDIDPIEV